MFAINPIVIFAFLVLISCYRAELIRDSTLDLNEIAWHWEKPQIFLGSPSILRLKSGILLASADRFGKGFISERNVSIYRSTDNGNTWEFKAWVKDQYWSNLFQLNKNSKDIYLLGTSTDGPAPIKISKSSDDGLTWDETTLLFGEIHGNSSYETGPTPSLISNGFVYRAMERLAPPLFRWGADYQAVCVYAKVGSDLLDKNSWTLSKPLPFNKSWIPSDWEPKPNVPGYLEGNMVEGPDGNIYDILRFNTRPYVGNKAIILKFNQHENGFIFDSIIELPGGHTKFVIHRDTSTGIYVTLSNPQTVNNATDQRNILSLCSSKDMRNWVEHKVILQDDTGFDMEDSIRYTGFHYVDWHFDGNDDENIIMAVRTAYRGAVSYHNSNRLTYKVIPNWRQIVVNDRVERLAAVVNDL
jgi:hypothetical protein